MSGCAIEVPPWDPFPFSTNGNCSSDKYPIYIDRTQQSVTPAIFTINGKQYLAVLFFDVQTFPLPQNALPGVASRPAQPGDAPTIYGVGFGPVTGGFAAGTIFTAVNSILASVFVFGAIPVTSS